VKTRQNAIFIAILLLAFLACAALWLWAGDAVTHIPSTDGARDLRGADFTAGGFDLFGPIEYIPNVLLTPDEFEARRGEAIVGDPGDSASYSTGRMRIYVPEGTYGLTMWNAGYAANIFINGRPVESVGALAGGAARSVPGTRLLYYTADAPDGMIEIVQQASEYGIKASGGHADVVIGTPEFAREVYMKQNIFPAVAMGCFLALFLAHLMLYFLLRYYRANIWFALFCLVWFIRTGYGTPWILSSLLPLSWSATFQVFYITYPVGVLLFYLALGSLFPGIFQKWSVRALASVCAAFVCVCLFTDTAFMLKAVPYFDAVLLLTFVYILIRVCAKLRRPNIEQAAILAGMGIAMLGALRDIIAFDTSPAFSFAAPAVSELTQRTATEYALLVFALFQMSALFRGTMREITAARETEQKLAMEKDAAEQRNQFKSELLAKVSHEMRTPLAVMSGYAQYAIKAIQNGDYGDESLQRLGAITREANRLAEMSSSILLMSKGLSAERIKLPISMSEIITNTASFYRPVMEKSNNRQTLRLSPCLPSVLGSKDELTQVLFNLLANADARTKNGEIGIAAESDGSFVSVTVSDTGCGIPPDLLPTVFEKERHGGIGSGYGLAICKEIIEGHGGTITIESVQNRGTAATFTVPASAAYTQR
jgi:signal transduction histidine kinase